MGRGSLQRRAEDLAALLGQRDEELVALRKLVRQVEAIATGQDFDHERVKQIKAALGAARRDGTIE